MERSSGSQQPVRGLPENPAQGVRRVTTVASNGVPVAANSAAANNKPTNNMAANSIATSNGMAAAPPLPQPLVPMPGSGSNGRLRNGERGGSNASLPPMPLFNVLLSDPVTPGQVVAMAMDAMQNALLENETQAVEASGVITDLKPGVTIDLSRKNIQKLPDEVVDIIKYEIERLALSHNLLSSFPARFAECTSLRYLNVRNNQIREFPLSLCDLRSLEILDLGRNKLRTLPPEIVKLASLKVFAVQKNRIEELPGCIADMVSLQVLKLDGNPINFPPREVFQVQGASAPNEGYLNDSELSEITVTANIKRYLRQRSQNGRTESENGGDESSEGTETPRLPIKRVASGRFPIKVNGTDVPDIRSPALPRPPPIPSRSHFRGLSQQNAPARKPGVMPLTMGNPNERLRSNSETLLQAQRAERSAERNRRMGMVSKKASDLGTLDETQANNRFSHNRGLSHGSAMQGNGNGIAVKSPATPTEPYLQRPNYVRRLSVLPERRRESKMFDPVVEAAKGILYSVFQIHPMIQMLMGLTNDGTSKRSSLEIVFYNTNVHVEELEQEIQKHDPLNGDDVIPKENENVQRACQTLISAYAHVCSLLASNIDMLVENGDARYIRTLLMLLYNSIMELRITMAGASPNDGYRMTANRAAVGDTIRPHSRENSVTPTAERPGINNVTAPITMGPLLTAPMSSLRPRIGAVANPSNLRVATDVPLSAYGNGSGSARMIIPMTSATPRSGESFASNTSSGRGLTAVDFNDEDRLFERIFLALQKSSDLVMRTLPTFNTQFTTGLKSAMAQRAPDDASTSWKVLIAKCTNAIQQTEMLKSRLSIIKLKEPGIRNQTTFWSLCLNFTEAWFLFAQKIRDTMLDSKIQLPFDTKTRLRPIQVAMKETTSLIMSSPWSGPNRQYGNGGGGSATTSPFGGSNGIAQSMASVTLPMTPQSAALGPAVQATVPSTPQSASFAAAFSGNVFERAEALMANGGLSMSAVPPPPSSRNGTKTNGNGVMATGRGGEGTNGSISSISSIGSSTLNDGSMTPASILSPGPLGALPFRFNNGSKIAY